MHKVVESMLRMAKFFRNYLDLGTLSNEDRLSVNRLEPTLRRAHVRFDAEQVLERVGEDNRNEIINRTSWGR
jgi:hypothetical protein